MVANNLRSAKWLEAGGVRGFLRRSSMQVHGLSAGDFMNRPIVGIANSWSEFNRCHLHFGMLVAAVKKGVWQAGGLPIEFPTMTMSADLASPSSFVNRNLLSMEVEETVRTYPMDAVVMLGACDDTIPGMLMAAASLDLPTIILPGGPGMNGNWRGEDVGSGTDSRRFYTALQRGEISEDDWTELEGSIDRTPGHCTTMGTAATMACIAEALGMAIWGSAAIPAVDSRKLRVAQYIGRRAVALVGEDRRPSSIMTPSALENALRVLVAVGGSTNAIIHLCALAGRLGLDFPLSLVDTISRQTPVIGNVKPAGEYLMEDFFDAGGVPALLRELRPLLRLDVESVNEEPMREAIDRASNHDRTIIRSLDDPLNDSGGLAVLHGTLAPGGSVLRVATASANLLRHTGRAVVFDSVDAMQTGIDDSALEIAAGDVLVLKGGGPRGGPGMPAWGWFPIPERLVRQGVQDMIRVSDSRMSGTAFGTVVLHVTPEAVERGPLAAVATGDRIRLDAEKRQIDLLVPQREIKRRLKTWTPPPPIAERGYTRLYVDHVLSVEKGCDFDFLVGRTSAGVCQTKVRAL